MQQLHVFWFRRDLRLEDNVGLYHALKTGVPVLPIFIFDSNILNELPAEDARVTFIYQTLEGLKQALKKLGSDLLVLHDTPLNAFRKLIAAHSIISVFTNHDYEPYAIARDKEVMEFLSSKNISFQTFKDQVIFEKNEVVKEDGTPFVVFTPYSKRWKQRYETHVPEQHPVKKHAKNFLQQVQFEWPTLEAIGFTKTTIKFPSAKVPGDVFSNYARDRDFPSLQGTFRLGMHLRFGTISIRQLAAQAAATSEKFLNELIWREFYMCLFWHFPEMVYQSFKPAYDEIVWRNDDEEFTRWCEGKTGIPIVDAGMRELNATGFMHNRVRMITASFLTKNLLIDWRKGEAYFAQKLLDYEITSNIGNWQWVAGGGVDAAPYFRIFNPITQQEKFDPEFSYIKRWIPEFGTTAYPSPIVDLKASRERCLQVYKAALALHRPG